MDKIDEFMILQDLEKKLKAFRWDGLNLHYLDLLRQEVTQRKNKLRVNR